MDTKPSRTKEEQVNAEGWVYVNTSKVIRGWNQVWVLEARGGLEADEGKALSLRIPFPIAYDPQG